MGSALCDPFLLQACRARRKRCRTETPRLRRPVDYVLFVSYIDTSRSRASFGVERGPRRSDQPSARSGQVLPIAAPASRKACRSCSAWPRSSRFCWRSLISRRAARRAHDWLRDRSADERGNALGFDTFGEQSFAEVMAF